MQKLRSSFSTKLEVNVACFQNQCLCWRCLSRARSRYIFCCIALIFLLELFAGLLHDFQILYTAVKIFLAWKSWRPENSGLSKTLLHTCFTMRQQLTNKWRSVTRHQNAAQYQKSGLTKFRYYTVKNQQSFASFGCKWQKVVLKQTNF